MHCRLRTRRGSSFDERGGVGVNEFQGYRVVVSGGASGIGRAIVEAFAAEGASVVFVDLNADQGEQVRKQAIALTGNPRIAFIVADLSDEHETARAAEMALRELGEVDVLVNNVGGNFRSGNVLQHSVEDFRRTFQLNVFSSVGLIRGLIPSMIARRKGAIINISSTMSAGAAGFSAYASTKGAINALTSALALDHAADNIRVNAIAPGLIATPLNQAWIDEQEDAAKVKGIPMNRVGKPEEIATVTLFLASDKSSYLTGQVLTVDGGMTVGE